MELKFSIYKFSELPNDLLYKILRLRAEVFVVEQNCAFQDLDNYDYNAFHLCGFLKDELVAYSRLLPAGVIYNETSVGRVVTSFNFRQKGFGKLLMHESLNTMEKLFPNEKIKIMGQLYLQKFYESFGFVVKSEPFLEDDILHVYMEKN